ncbi:5'-adenylylsulfate reductase-like 5 [Actinidia eriantha]|uniref:5'-adenylylsulfate reductase-like 5 n=1 Tax=Actinidia eriantha TaxID=165200 RepID=UPI00258C75B2|nr:5'-adenylylsulfate reductase-like 5 [Actinidia eriantha]
MAIWKTSPLLSLCISVVVSSLRCGASASPPMCPLQSPSLLHNLQPQCPLSVSDISALEVHGDFLDRTLTSKRGSVYTAVLFYTSRCQFSLNARLTFEALSFMFPQIEHLAVEQSSAMPIIFSIYGIHSIPTILMVNQTSRMRVRGSKDVHSLVKFYKRTTGFEPVNYVTVDQSLILESSGKVIVGSLLNERLKRDPYLIFSIMFLCLRVLVFLFPKVMSRFRAFWVSYVPHLNLEIFGETSQILSRVLHMISVRRIWAKLTLWKTRNFHEGARNARVLASSLASVSLGEPPSLR